jgi:hypothetical protein
MIIRIKTNANIYLFNSKRPSLQSNIHSALIFADDDASILHDDSEANEGTQTIINLETEYPFQSINYEDIDEDEEDINLSNDEMDISALPSARQLLKHIFQHASIGCPCGNDHIEPDYDNNGKGVNQSLSELTTAWYSAVPNSFGYEQSLLERSNGVFRDDTELQDFNNIQFENFLAPPPQSTKSQTQLHRQLCIAKSDQFDLSDLQVFRVFDIDSSIFYLLSLEAIKSSINIAYCAPHHKTFVHNTHFPIRIGSSYKEFHKLKNVCFGAIHQKAGCVLHIFFPNLSLSGSKGVNTLTKDESSVWINTILVPAIKKSIPVDIQARHPSTFLDAITRNASRAGNKKTPSIEDVRYDIPAEHLGDLWQAINQRCRNFHTTTPSIPDNAFHNPILLLSLHGTKSHIRDQSLTTLLERNFTQIEALLDFAFVDTQNSYQDIGIEDVPNYEDSPITLLRKTSCIKHWIQQFACPHGGRRIKEYQYNWALTRDAGSGEFECRPSNTWYVAGLAHAKAYNINKEVFSGFNNSSPFTHPAFEFIGLDTKTLVDVLQRCKWEGFERRGVTLENIIHMLRSTTERLRTTLNDKMDKNFGVRQEYRIRVSVLQDLNRNSSQTQHIWQQEDISEHIHRHFWAIPTSIIHMFMKASIERWLWLTETALSFSRPVRGNWPPAIESSLQQWFCISNIAAIFTLRVFFNGQVQRQSLLWKARYGQGPSRPIEDNEQSITDEHHTQRQGYFGLHFKQSIDEWGVAYFPKGYLLYGTQNMPVFKRKILNRFGLIKKSIVPFGLTLPNLDNPIIANNRRTLILQHLLMKASNWDEYSLVLVTAAQLCVQAYIRQVYRTLYNRSVVSKSHKSQKTKYHTAFETFTKFLEPLDHDERAGLVGLDADIIDKLFRGHTEGKHEASGWLNAINISRMRRTAPDQSFKDLIDSTKYVQILRPIFDPRLDWIGAPRWVGYTENIIKPKWPQNEFRVFLNEIWHMIDNIQPPKDCLLDGEHNKAWAEFEDTGGFLMLLCIQAAKTLWVTLAYEKQDWSSIKKPDGSSSKALNQLINTTPQMKRTKFWVLAPPVDTIQYMTKLQSERHPEWKLSWCRPMQLSRDIHDSIYISLLNDCTNLSIPPEYTVKTSAKLHEDNNLLLRLPRGISPQERHCLFFWRTLGMAKAMDETIQQWGEEIRDAHEDIEDRGQDDWYNNSDGRENEDEDEDEDEDENESPLAMADKWANLFLTKAQEEMDEVLDWHFIKGVKKTQTSVTAPPRRTTWREEGALANNKATKIQPPPQVQKSNHIYFRHTVANGAMQYMPRVLIPGVDFPRDIYSKRILDLRRQYPLYAQSEWGELIAEHFFTSRSYWIGGPNDIVRKKHTLRRYGQKGFQFRISNSMY